MSFTKTEQSVGNAIRRQHKKSARRVEDAVPKYLCSVAKLNRNGLTRLDRMHIWVMNDMILVETKIRY
jgi:hypothetical protein